MTTAKQQAVQDIQDDLTANHKSFLAFKPELNPVMESIVSTHLMMQLIFSINS